MSTNDAEEASVEEKTGDITSDASTGEAEATKHETEDTSVGETTEEATTDASTKEA